VNAQPILHRKKRDQKLSSPITRLISRNIKNGTNATVAIRFVENRVRCRSHPILRHSHQIPAANTKQIPSGSGTRNAPQAARAIGDLISRTLMMGTACGVLASGRGKS
jgi:hypothetical protein